MYISYNIDPYCFRWKRTFNALTKYGIKGPPPTLFYGNTKQIVEKV